MKLTVDAIMSLSPWNNYHPERVEALLDRPLDTDEEVFEFLSLIPVEDTFWFLVKFLTKQERTQWVDACARRAKEYAEKVADTVARADAAHWAAHYADVTARAAHYAASDDADAAYWAVTAAHYASRVADYSAARKTEQQLAIRHGVHLLGEAK